MIYLDTNLVVAMLIAERASAKVREWVASQTVPLSISVWTRVEFRSALGLKVRIGELSQRQADSATRTFEEILLPSLKEWPIERRHFLRCLALLKRSRHGLRGPDALHLAVCLEAESLVLATSDLTLYKCARASRQSARLLP